MERQAIQIGPPDAGQGDDWYTAFNKVEANFSALFASPLMGDVAAVPDPGSSASGNELVPASWVLAKLAGVAALAGVSALKPVFQAAKLLGGEEGVGIDFLARELLINDYSAVLTWSGRPSEKITISRPSTKWVVGRNRLLTSVAADAIAYNHDPLTGAPKGARFEAAATNLLLRSAELDGAAWTGSQATVTANTATAPDGTVTMDAVAATAVAGEHTLAQTVAGTTNANAYCLSWWVKAASLSKCRLDITEGATLARTAQVTVDLAAGTVTSATAAGGATVAGSGCIAYAGGLYRVWIAGTLGGADTSIRARLALLDAAGAATFTGDGTAGVHAWGAQLEAGSYPTSYVPTTTAAATRQADTVTIATTLFPFDAAAVSVVVECSVDRVNAATAYICEVTDGTTSNRISLYISSANATSGSVTTGGVAQVSAVGTDNPASGAVRRVAMAVRADDFALSVGGAAPQTDASVAMPAMTQVRIGSRAGGVQHLNGDVRRIAVITRRSTNAEIQSLSLVA